MNNFADLLKTYSQLIPARTGLASDLCLAAEMLACGEKNMLLRRHKPKKNNFSELLELYMTPVEARKEEEPISEVKEREKMICALCGKELDIYECPEEGRPLIDGKVCGSCKKRCRDWEDELKSKYPDSLRYFYKAPDESRE